ncbi:MAG TPA: NADH-quinone oxidoreductase subunit C [Bacilli bacterium]|nr:NADH-quinone oxidoreductase subunit C [Bacilli bacterium]
MSEETKAPGSAKASEEEAPAPVDPRVERATELLDLVKAKIVEKFGEEAVEEAEVKQFRATLVIQTAKWAEVVEFVKTEPSLLFVYPQLMAGTDFMAKGYCEVYTMLHSFQLDQDLSLKVRADRDNAVVPSITPIFSGFNWEEREIYDLVGITFEGHPDMRRIMLEDYWEGHPLRKDYVVKN